MDPPKLKTNPHKVVKISQREFHITKDNKDSDM